MFTIIGGDGKEYGPATTAQVRAWITAGRANLDTKARAAGSEEWRRLADFPEFAGPLDAPPVMAGGDVIAAEASPLQLADRGTRLAARLIDWVLEMIVSIPGLMILGGEFLQLMLAAARGEKPDLEQLDLQRLGLGALVLIIGSLTLLIVQIVMLSTRGQSIGKRLLKIRIVRALDDSKPGFLYGWLMRELLITVIGSAISMVIPIAGIALRFAFHLTDWCLIFREDNRCLHDMIAGTKVVKL